MPINEWINTQPDKPSAPKTLDEVKVERQEQAEAPKPQPETELPTEQELKPLNLKEIAGSIESAAEVLLDTDIGLKKAEVKLSKATLDIDKSGPGAEIITRVDEFKHRILQLGVDIETISKNIASYKSSLNVDDSEN